MNDTSSLMETTSRHVSSSCHDTWPVNSADNEAFGIYQTPRTPSRRQLPTIHVLGNALSNLIRPMAVVGNAGPVAVARNARPVAVVRNAGPVAVIPVAVLKINWMSLWPPSTRPGL